MQGQHSNPEDKELQIQNIAQALISALGVNPAEVRDKIQTATIFISRLYRKYSVQVSKNFQEIKLTRFNGFLYKISKDHPSSKQDIELIYHIILSFLYNEGHSSVDSSKFAHIEGSYASNTCIWIGRFLEDVLAIKHPDIAVQLIQTLLKIKKPILMSAKEFDSLITKSAYFKDKEISREDERKANEKNIYRGFMSQISIHGQILQNLNPINLFINLQANHQARSIIIKLFLPFCNQTEVQNLKQIFIKIFINEKTQTKQSLEAIFACVDSQYFTGEASNQIFRMLLNFNERKLLYSLPINNFKCKNRFLETLMEDRQPNLLDQIAQTFIQQQQINNYYLIYLINKSKRKLSEKFIALPFSAPNKIITNREAIICILSIYHHFQSAHQILIRYFFIYEVTMSNKQKLDCLRLVHFSYFKTPISHFLIQIGKKASVSALDQESNFQFLSKSEYEKRELNLYQQEYLKEFLSKYIGSSSPEMFKLKVDLYTACDTLKPYMEDFNKVQTIFQSSIPQIISNLACISQNLLPLILMGVNNKLEDQLDINQNTMTSIIQWDLDLLKKQQRKFVIQVREELKKTNNENLLDLCIEIFYFNLDQHDDKIQFEEGLKQITSTNVPHKLNGLNFSQYFMRYQNQEGRQQKPIFKCKILLIQLKKIIKFLQSGCKIQNKRQFKRLVTQEVEQLRALKIIKLLSNISSGQQINPQRLRMIIENLLTFIPPDEQNFRQLSTKSNSLNIEYVPIFESLEFLIKVNYEVIVNFMARLIKSKDDKSQKKSQSKPKEEPNKDNPEKKSESSKISKVKRTKKMLQVVQNIQICFRGDPNSLKSYQDIITIIEYCQNTQKKQTFPQQLTKWVSKIEMFPTTNFNEWKQKVSNYIGLWIIISGIISRIIEQKEIERHFLMMVEMLNILYEKYKLEKDLNVEKKLLTGLYILYLIDSNKSKQDQMYEQKPFEIPQEKLNMILANCELPLQTGSHVYYCFDCSKKVCHQCVELIHRQHDIAYTGQGNENQCHKIFNKNNPFDKKSLRQKYLRYLVKQIKDKGSIGPEKELDLQRVLKLIKDSPKGAQILQKLIQKQEKNPNNKSIELRKTIELDEELKKQIEEEENLDLVEIKSCSQKQFIIYTPSYRSNTGKPKLSFENVAKNFSTSSSKINLTPLFNLLAKQLKNRTFFITPQMEVQQKNSSLVDAEVSNQKYTLFKHDDFKYTVLRMAGINYLLLQANSGQIVYRRNSVTFNENYIAVLGGANNQIHYLKSKAIQDKFLKRESEKKYKDTDSHQNYIICRNKCEDVSTSQFIFSPFIPNQIAEIAYQKITFKQITKEGAVKIFLQQKIYSGEILKFEWIQASELKSFYSYLAREIVIKKVAKAEKQFTEIKMPLGKTKIKDYCNTAVTPTIVIFTILDSEGKLYRSKVNIIGRKVPNFRDYPINFENPDPIQSINCHSTSIYCSTRDGKILILNVDDENILTSQPIICSILDNLKKHRLSDQLKQLHKITKLKYITKNKNQILLAAILLKQSPIEPKKLGFFALISINTQTSKSKVTLFNDQGTTDSYDFLKLTQREYMFICLQESGEIWATKHNIRNKNIPIINDYDFGFSLPITQIHKYAEEIKEVGLMNNIKFYSKERKLNFKQNTKITDHFTININQNEISMELIFKHIRNHYITGIQFVYNINEEQKNDPTQLVFSFLGNVYRYEISSTRQIQIPFTIKQSLSLYFDHEQYKIYFLQGNPIPNIKNINIFGIKWNQKSVYSESLVNLAKLMHIYKGQNNLLGIKKVQSYFFNQYKQQLNDLTLQQLETYFKLKQFSPFQQNLFMKLELLRSSIESSNFNDIQLYEFFENLRNHILPKCSGRRELTCSAQKLFHKLTVSSQNQNSLKVGHILNEKTQMDIYNIFKLYSQFVTEPNIDIFQYLLSNICKILNNRILNGYIIYSIYPRLLHQICNFMRKVMVDFRTYFKTTSSGLLTEQRTKLNTICRCFIRILIQDYQLLKNKKQSKFIGMNCEHIFLKVFQSIFGINKKQIRTEMKFNPFRYLQPPFQCDNYQVANPPLNFLEISQVKLQQPPPIIVIPQPAIVPSQPSPSQFLQSQNPLINFNVVIPKELLSQQKPLESFEEHKQPEQQNRQMEEQYIYKSQPSKSSKSEKDMGEEKGEIPQKQIQKMEQQQNIVNEEDQKKELVKLGGESKTKKFYEYLLEFSTRPKPAEITFEYAQLCQNLLIEIFNYKQHHPQNKSHKYLNSRSISFFVDLAYNIFLIIEKTLTNMFQDSSKIDFNHPYISSTIFKIIKAIDHKLDSPSFSFFYLSLNSVIAYNAKTNKSRSFFLNCLKHYYSINITESNLLQCMISSHWYPSQRKEPATLNEVLRCECSQYVNPLYQIKYVGNMYLHLKNLNLHIFEQNKQLIKKNVLKAVVKYNLRVYQNIMIMEGWIDTLEQTKINVAFEELKINPEKSLRAIMKSLVKNYDNFIESMNKFPERVNDLESMMGENGTINCLVMDILNYFYSKQ